MAVRQDARFVAPRPGDMSSRWCLWTAPVGIEVRGLVVQVHAFAEEMNKSRRMVALQSRALAEAGYVVLQMDLLGCGDSAGDSGDATWAAWCDDVDSACDMVLGWPDGALRANQLQLWLWGLRSGCLLASEVASRRTEPWNLLFWQPVTQGKTVFHQFLRLAAVGGLMGKDRACGVSARERLARGESVTVAGYELHPALARGLEAARLSPPVRQPVRVEWLDVSMQPDAAPSQAAQQNMIAWQDAGYPVRHHAVVGPSFWQTTEIEDAPALITATLEAMTQPVAEVESAPAVQTSQ